MGLGIDIGSGAFSSAQGRSGLASDGEGFAPMAMPGMSAVSTQDGVTLAGAAGS